MKIIIVGCGKIGAALAGRLAGEGHDVTVVDALPEVVDRMTNACDVMGIVGNGADSDVLNESGAAEADLFISVTGSDELNMLACFLAKKFGSKHTVARIRNPEYNDASLEFLKKQLSLSVAVNPDRLAANEIYNILRLPSAVGIERFSGGLEMVELKLKDDSVLDGMTLLQLRTAYSAKILVCCVCRGDEVIIPGGSFALKSGDRIGITGAQTEVQKFLREVKLLQKKSKSVMILGGSRIAYYLAEKVRASGGAVKIIEQDKKSCEELCELLPGCEIINANGSEQDVLIEEGLLSCDAFVSLTGFDELNILSSIFAQSENVPKVVAKINGDNFVKMGGRLGLDSVVYPEDSVSDVITSYVRALDKSGAGKVEMLYELFDEKVEAAEFTAGNEFRAIGQPLKKLNLKKNMLIAGIIRSGKAIIPGGNDFITAGDRVIVISGGNRLVDLDDILA